MYYKHYKPNIRRCALLFRISGVQLSRHFKQSHARCASHRLMLWFFFRFYRWRLCPTGYYLNSFSPYHKLLQIRQCCRPQHHPKSYGHCYDKDVTRNSRWIRCQEAGYYITGYSAHRSCSSTKCIRKLKCCKMTKTGNSTLLDSHFDKESAVK